MSPSANYNFTDVEINLVIEALGKLPAERVYQLLGKIERMASQESARRAEANAFAAAEAAGAAKAAGEALPANTADDEHP